MGKKRNKNKNKNKANLNNNDTYIDPSKESLVHGIFIGFTIFLLSPFIFGIGALILGINLERALDFWAGFIGIAVTVVMIIVGGSLS